MEFNFNLTHNITELVLQFFIAVLAGGMIGLEREKAKQLKKEQGPIGIRTEILFSIFGAFAIISSQLYSSLIFFICFLAAILYTSFPLMLALKHNTNLNIKTSLSSVMAFLLGSLAMMGEIRLSIIIAITITMVLSMKHAFAKAANTISYNEIIDALKFVVIAFIVLPFLPNQAYDLQLLNFFQFGTEVFTNPEILQSTSCHPVACDVLNPYRIWLLIVIISGLNFLGYIMVKAFGQNKGYSFTGLMGGFYSSTVTSLTLSTLSKQKPQIKAPFVIGIIFACAAAFFKMFILISTLNPQLFEQIFPILLIMCSYLFLTGIIMYIVTNRKKQETKNTPSLEEASQDIKLVEVASPLNMGKAFKLTAIITATLIVANLILTFTNINFYYILSAIMSFFAVVEPIVISTAEISGKAISLETGKVIIVIAVLLNMFQKTGTMYFFGNKKLTKPLALVFGGLLLVTILALIYL